MQKKVQIVSDGSLDLPQEITDAHDIEVVPFYVSFNGETYQKEIEEIGIREFYQEMVDHPDVFPKSSMPSVDDFYQIFVKSTKENIPVICICITTKFSGSLQSATVAKEMVKDEYPEARITVIDSTVNTVLQGLLYWRHAECVTWDWIMRKSLKESFLSVRPAGSSLQSEALII